MSAVDPNTTAWLVGPTIADLDDDRAPCPKCPTGRLDPRHYSGDFAFPECDWYECDQCGYKTEPR